MMKLFVVPVSLFEGCDLLEIPARNVEVDCRVCLQNIKNFCSCCDRHLEPWKLGPGCFQVKVDNQDKEKFTAKVNFSCYCNISQYHLIPSRLTSLSNHSYYDNGKWASCCDLGSNCPWKSILIYLLLPSWYI